MPHYLIQGSYTAEGCQGLIAEGATVRVEDSSSLIASFGCTLESMYYVLGTDDVIGVCEMPDDAAAAAASLAVSSSGKVGVQITPLIPAGDIDVAAAKAREVTYRAPGT